MSVSILTSLIHITGSQVIYQPNFFGLGGTLVIQSGDYIFISGAAGAGTVTQNQLNSLSGQAESIYVHRTGNELISGNKFFSGNVGFGTTGASVSVTLGMASILGWENSIGIVDTTFRRDIDGNILVDKEIRLRGTNALFGVNNYNPTDRAFATDTPTDANNRFTIDGNGGMAWGPGVTVVDTSFGRIGTGVLLMTNADKGTRFLFNSLGSLIDGVNSAAISYQPLYVGGSELNLTVSGNPRITLNSSGLGIGTTNPGATLHVNGTICLSGIQTSTTANVGAATLPAGPVGFVIINITGSNFKVPYYNI